MLYDPSPCPLPLRYLCFCLIQPLHPFAGKVFQKLWSSHCWFTLPPSRMKILPHSYYWILYPLVTKQKKSALSGFGLSYYSAHIKTFTSTILEVASASVPLHSPYV